MADGMPKKEHILQHKIDSLTRLLCTSEQLAASDNWNKLLKKLNRKHKTSNAYFLKHLFYKTHQVFLKEYRKHSEFRKLLETGKYDCLSGSITYAILLETFGYNFEVIETDYHVFVVANIDGKKYILESTDPIEGFMEKEKDVKDYLAEYTPNSTAESLIMHNREIGSSTEPAPERKIFRAVNMKQLSGLQYYNNGIAAINERDYTDAIKQLRRAYMLYPSDRVISVYQMTLSLEKD
jgi:hypothetical protein